MNQHKIRTTMLGCALALLLGNGLARAGVIEDTRSWTKRDFSGGPVGRFWHYMTYAGSGKVLVVAGNLAAGTETVTWFWDGASGSWSNIPADPPPPAKNGAIALAYDAQRGRALFFGGSLLINNGFVDSNELWELDPAARQWKKLTPAGPAPSARSNAAFTYDPVRKRTLLQSGYFKGNDIGDTWEWDGTRWTKLSPATRPRGASLGLLWMPDRQKIYGFYAAGSIQAWAWDGQDWHLESEQQVPEMPSAPALTYAGSGRVVAFGGYLYENNKQTAYGDTFEWSRGTWTKVTTAQKPSIREASVAVYDESRDRAVLYGGRSFPNGNTGGSIDVRSDLWEYAITGVTTGSACESSHADRCATGNCVEGVCCGSARCGSCESCQVAGSEGRCAPLDPLPPACMPPSPDAGLPAMPDAAVPPPGTDAAIPTIADAGAPVGGRGGSTGTSADGAAGGPGRSDGGGGASGGGASGGGSTDEEGDAGAPRSVKTPGPSLYSGPACAFAPVGRGSLASFALFAAGVLLAMKRRSRR
jgi:hypothetical protein